MDPEKGCSSVELKTDRFSLLAEKLVNVEILLKKNNNHKNSYVPNLTELTNPTRSKAKLRKFRGKESIFKRPEGPAPKTNIKTIPDYRRNPTKWTCYSLDDVSEMSDQSNSEAATAFLKELKQMKRNPSHKQNKVKERLKLQMGKMEIDEDTDVMDSCSNNEEEEERFIPGNSHKNAVLFKKSQKEKDPLKEELKPEFRNSKVIMPEYEIGSKKTLKKKTLQKSATEKSNKTKALKLELLSFNDEEDHLSLDDE